MTRTDRILEVALGLAFLAAGAIKVADPADFAVVLSKLGLLPPLLIGAAAILLPWVEIVAGLALLVTRRYRDAAEWLILGLLLIFTVVLAASVVRGTAGSCGCFGDGLPLLNHPAAGLTRNGLLIAAAATLIVRRRKATSPAGPASPASGTGR